MIYKYKYNEILKLDRNVACIGYFDGIHKGHQSLIEKTIYLAKQKNLKPLLITFDPNPHEIITKEKVKQIYSLNRRIELVNKMGIDDILIIEFDEKLKNLSKENFISVLKDFNVDTIVCGFDFSFGYLGKGNFNTFLENDLNTVVIEEKKYYGKKISSTRIRNELEKGNIKLVEKLLGHEYK